MSYPQPKVSIIIVHWKDISCLKDCLTSLNKILYDNYDIIIVNNGSNSLNGVCETTKEKTRIIQNPSNIGFTGGNNLGIKEALKNQADYVLLLNDDTVVSPDFLNILVNYGENHPDAGMLGPKVYYFDEPKKISFAGAELNKTSGFIYTPHYDEIDNNTIDEIPVESDYVTGCALLVKKSLIEKIGLLDERFFLYWEDIDWGLRSKKANFNNMIIPASKIWHKISTSSGGPNSPLKLYHKTRGHLLLADLHLPETKYKIMLKFMRDIAWLLFKSSDPDRIKKARAYFAAIKDYYLRKTDRGPLWLWENKES